MLNALKFAVFCGGSTKMQNPEDTKKEEEIVKSNSNSIRSQSKSKLIKNNELKPQNNSESENEIDFSVKNKKNKINTNQNLYIFDNVLSKEKLNSHDIDVLNYHNRKGRMIDKKLNNSLQNESSPIPFILLPNEKTYLRSGMASSKIH